MSSVRVAVRVRPLSEQEAERGNTRPVVGMDSRNMVSVLNPNKGYKTEKLYPFDGVLWSVDEDPPQGVAVASQEFTYKTLCSDLVGNTFKGYNNCLLAYGQTGTGKTYTMIGGKGESRGVIPRMCEDLISKVVSERAKQSAISMTASYMEIYMEKVYDLLGKDSYGSSLRVRQHPTSGVFVENLVQKPFEDLETLLSILQEGSASRHTAETKMNTNSSRSHAIFTINFCSTEELPEVDQVLYGVHENTKTSKLHLVDLAGSEVVAKSGAEGVTFAEATNINLSLTTLGRVIDSLCDISRKVKGAQAPPYRDSMLTFILSDSVGGNSKTSMVATISPHCSSIDETLNTLRYASRARDVVNNAVTNEDPTVRRIRELREDNEKLKRQMNTIREKTTLAAEDMKSDIINLKSENELLKARSEKATTSKPNIKKLKAPPKPEPKLVSCLKSASKVQVVDPQSSKELVKLKDDLKTSEKERKKLVIKHEKLAIKTEKKKEASVVKAGELRQRLSETDMVNTQLAEENDALIEELQELTYNHQKLKTKCKNMNDTTVDLKQTVVALESEKEAAAAKASEFTHVQELVEKKNQELNNLQRVLKDVKTNSKAGEARHIKVMKQEVNVTANMKSKMSSLERENIELKHQLAVTDARHKAPLFVQKWELVVEDANSTKIAQLMAEVTSLEDRLTSNLEEHLDEAGELRAMLAEQRSLLSEQEEASATRIEGLTNDLQMAYNTLRKSNNSKEELTKRLVEVQGNHDILTVANEASEQELATLRVEVAKVDELKQELLEQMMNRDSQETVAGMQKANIELRNKVSSLEADIAAINELQVKVNDLHKHEVTSMQREYAAAAKRNASEEKKGLLSKIESMVYVNNAHEKEKRKLEQHIESLNATQQQMAKDNASLRTKLQNKTVVDTTKEGIMKPVGKLSLESTEIKELLEAKVAARKKQVLTSVAHVLHCKALIRCNTFWKWVLWSKEQQSRRTQQTLTAVTENLKISYATQQTKAGQAAEMAIAALQAKLMTARTQKAAALKRVASSKKAAEKHKKLNKDLRRWKDLLLEYTASNADVHLKLSKENTALKRETNRLQTSLAQQRDEIDNLDDKLQSKTLLLQKSENERVNPSKGMQLELRYQQLREYCVTEMINTKQAHSCLYLQFEQREYDNMMLHFDSHIRDAKRKEAKVAAKLDAVMGHSSTFYDIYSSTDEEGAVDTAVEALVDLFNEIRDCGPKEVPRAVKRVTLSAERCISSRRSKSPANNMKRLSMSVSALQASSSTLPQLEEEILPLKNARELAQGIVKLQAPFVEDFFTPEEAKPSTSKAASPKLKQRAPFQDLPTNTGATPTRSKSRAKNKKDKCTVM